MAHIVFLTTRYTSHLNSCYHVADRLRQQGHRLTIVSAFYVSAGVKAQGFEFVLLEREALVHKNREGPREHFLEQRELDEVLKQLAPDLLLIDEELSAYIIIAASHNIRTLLYQCWTGTRSGYGVPPLGSTLQPGKTIAQRLKIEAIRRTKRLKRKVVLPVARYCYSGNDRHSNVYRYSTIYKLAENRGFDIRQFNTDHWPALFFRHVPTLFLNAWELDLPNAIREEDLEWFVGPQIFLKRTQTNIDSDFSEAFAYMTQPDVSGTKVPIVYCAMGSIVGDLDYFQRVVQAFAKRPHYRLLLSTGPQVSTDDLGTLPPNVKAFSSVPQLDVLRHADLMLCHGGITTINECIFFGVPMIVYSAGYTDEDSNAVRIEHHGLGVRGDMNQESAMDIAKRVDSVLKNAEIKTNVQHMKAVYQKYREADKATALIEQALMEPEVV